VESVQDSIVKACEFLIRWREQNLGDELRGGKGYGMISGKIADPEDHFHSFMLNAGTYAGLSRAAEMLACCSDGVRQSTLPRTPGAVEASGASGRPDLATSDIGRASLEHKITSVLATIAEVRSVAAEIKADQAQEDSAPAAQ